MTPLASQFLKELIKSRGLDKEYTGELVKASCFDLSQVTELAKQTVASLHSTRQHGGLLFLPNDPTWVEFRGKELGFGALLMSDNPNTLLISHPDASSGATLVEYDNDTFNIRTADKSKGGAYHISVWCIAALVLINAPYGIERERREVHKGLARQVRQAGLGELKPSNTIRLSLSAPPKEYAAGQGGSSKAFHFCRAHVRRLHTGVTTKVKAHWRGDPRLGVLKKDYRVTP